MRRQLTAVVSFAFVAASGAVLAHHSFAMFDQENPIELEGVVQEFKFTSSSSWRSSSKTAAPSSGASKALLRARWSVTGGRARRSSQATN